MLNLRPYTDEDSSAVHRGIVLSLNDKEKRDSLMEVEVPVFRQFEIHKTQSQINALEIISPIKLTAEIAQYLKGLYSSRRKKIVEIKNSIITSEQNRVNNLCQYCTINTVGPLDHIMPKDKFPEFTIYPENLFPCCAECNSIKSEIWLHDGNRQFLNLYLDILPKERYLFVRLRNTDTVPEVDFYLENVNAVDIALFQLISSHYTRLRLLDRFNLSSHAVMSDLRFTLEGLRGRLTLQEAKAFVIEHSERRMSYYGSNFWKCILEIALVEDDCFLKASLGQ